MKSIHKYFAATGMLIATATAAQKSSYLVEAENFQFKGGWVTERVVAKNISGNTILKVLSGKHPAADALTVINIPQAGQYTVWVRSADYPKDRPGTRLFRVAVNETSLTESGTHGHDGFYWEKAGTVTLGKGETVLRLQDTKANFGRCDAVFITADTTLNPNAVELTQLQAYATKPVAVKASPVVYPSLSPSPVIQKEATVIAAIENNNIRLRFIAIADEGKKRLAVKTEINNNHTWISMNNEYADHKVYLLRAEEPQLTYGNFFPSWNGSTGFTSFTSNGKTYNLLEPENAMNPFMSGALAEAIPVEAKKISSNAIEVKYQTNSGEILTGTWSIANNAKHLSITINYKAKTKACYSIGVAAFQSIAADSATAIQLPPMFQYRRISPQPVMLVNAMMQQPLAITETNLASGTFSTFVSGDSSSFPLDWGQAYTSTMGFTVKNEANRIQPVAFAPVLGLNDSKLSAGQSIQRSFVIGAVASGWNEAMEYISNEVYHVKDYRTQTTSLTDAIFNMFDLLKNDTASGWDATLKGFYDIEGDPKTYPTVVQSSPLTLVSAALLTQDEDFYIKRALPTIEYTLSRSGFRWAKGIVPTSFNNTKKTLLLNPYTSQFTTGYYEGLYRLLQEANPWIKDIALPEGKIRAAKGYSVDVPSWVQELAAYRLTKDNKWLKAAKSNADQYIATAINSNKITKPLNTQPFYNAGFYAYWWNLVDLYEYTKEEKYLQAASTSAFQTIAGIRSYPVIKDSLQTIHAGNRFDGNTTMWWKGDKKYRLGFPRVAGDAQEKQVKESLVSPVGLGFEQPYTYFDPGKTVRPVYMSSWAPHLLRLYQYTNRNIFNIYARNAVIGRFANYPGYYAPGFTDITMQPDFPYKGPDVSSIYYHHIPPHLAFSMDYLFSEMIQRSNGKISFPYGEQEGFVWFTNRLFGAGKGTVLGDDEVKLWMKRGLVMVDQPSINYITAISKDRFYVMLLNEADQPTTANITLGKEVNVGANATATIQGSNTSSKVTLNNKQVTTTIVAKGLSVLSFPLTSPMMENKTPPIKEGMKVIDLGEPWGKMFVFRIRSPFGWDSIYGYLETAPLTEKVLVTVSLNDSTATNTAYPFEWSFYKIDRQQKAEMSIELRTSDGGVKHETVVMDN